MRPASSPTIRLRIIWGFPLAYEDGADGVADRIVAACRREAQAADETELIALRSAYIVLSRLGLDAEAAVGRDLPCFVFASIAYTIGCTCQQKLDTKIPKIVMET